MKKALAILIFALNSLMVQSQIVNPSQSMPGLEIGVSKGCYGIFGVYYTYRPDFFRQHVEFNSGLGEDGSFVYGIGAKYRLYSNSKNLDLFLSFNYSHRGAGNAVEDVTDLTTDEYYLSSTQFLHYYIALRYYEDSFFALQACVGYAQNISGYSIQLINGTNANYRDMVYLQSSEILLELDFIVTFKRKGQP